MADWEGAVAAIEALFAAAWGATTPVGYENQPPPAVVDGSGNQIPWVYIEVTGTTATIIGTGTPGNQTVLDDGLITIHAYAATGAGRATARANARQAGEIFRVKKFYDTDPGAYVRTWTPRMLGGGPGSDDGIWWRQSVVIPFEFWHRA
jgi:hypothetical protein